MERLENPYYSTKTAFDWLLCHFFLNGNHFAWIAPEFFTYGLPNPPTSNPLSIYQQYYVAWKDGRDNSWTLSKRLRLRAVIETVSDAGGIDHERCTDLKELIDVADISFFYPLVYTLEFATIHESRLRRGGCRSQDSLEFFVQDLREDEFSLLFANFRDDPELRRFVLEIPEQNVYVDSYEILEFIDSRRIAK